MKELKCPNCGHVFQVDDDIFQTLAAQVRNEAFNDELERRSAEIRSQIEAEMKLSLAKKEQEFAARLDKSDKLLAEAHAKAEMASNQLKESEKRRLLEIDAAKRDEAETAARKLTENEARHAAEVADLRMQLARADDARSLALLKQHEEDLRETRERENTIHRLQLEIEAKQRESEQRENALKERYDLQLKEKEATIDLYKNFKARLSTKGVGESLEVHCFNEFEAVRGLAFPNASFCKDNEVVAGTKGDFIFRDYIDGEEYISIMFEMKNETDTTATHHRNDEFFKKLDSDRKKKNCEYAVLVSMLEPDSELYNKGIVDVSHHYEKMFVIRPQFFLSIIGLLSKGARSSFSLRRELEEQKKENISFANFENRLNTISQGIFKNYTSAHSSIEKSVKFIDSTVASLTKLKEEMQRWEKHMSMANDKAKNLTVKHLTHGNPTVKKLIQEAAKNDKSSPEEPDDIDLWIDAPEA